MPRRVSGPIVRNGKLILHTLCNFTHISISRFTILHISYIFAHDLLSRDNYEILHIFCFSVKVVHLAMKIFVKGKKLVCCPKYLLLIVKVLHLCFLFITTLPQDLTKSNNHVYKFSHLSLGFTKFKG